MTMGPSLLFLAALDRGDIPPGSSTLLIFGRVPMLFYILHLYLIHWLAVVVAVLARPAGTLALARSRFCRYPQGYGHGLGFVYIMWFTVTVILYFPCRRFAALKQKQRDWWLSYL